MLCARLLRCSAKQHEIEKRLRPFALIPAQTATRNRRHALGEKCLAKGVDCSRVGVRAEPVSGRVVERATAAQGRSDSLTQVGGHISAQRARGAQPEHNRARDAKWHIERPGRKNRKLRQPDRPLPVGNRARERDQAATDEHEVDRPARSFSLCERVPIEGGTRTIEPPPHSRMKATRSVQR
eukprot:scaffold124674_cov32-Tisochrysis_lutea.AAC.3